MGKFSSVTMTPNATFLLDFTFLSGHSGSLQATLEPVKNVLSTRQQRQTGGQTGSLRPVGPRGPQAGRRPRSTVILASAVGESILGRVFWGEYSGESILARVFW